MTAFPKYPKYKDSGVEWLGDVPEHWDVLPGRTCLMLNKDKNEGNHVSTVLSLSYGRVVIKPPEKLTGLVPASFEGYQIIQPGDVIIRPTDLQNDTTSLRVGLAKDAGIITSAYLGLRPVKKASSEYLYYLLHAYDLMKVYYGMGTGMRQSLDWRDFKYLNLCLPPRAEQARIVAFLDEKTAEIDRLIAKKQRQIELLDEQKAILINRAVTRGLHPQAELQDSGIPWIGPIPKGWKVLPFRRLIDSICDGPFGSGLTSAHYTEAGTRVIRLGNIGKAAFKDDDKAFISPVYAKQLVHHSVQRGDLLVAGLGDGNHPVGRACIYESDEEAIVKADCYRVRLNDQRLNRYVCHYLSSRAGAAGFAAQTRGSTRSRVNLEITREVPVVVPDATEADEIASFIVALSADSLRASSTIESQIQTLQTLRSTLIAHAVTGKIKV
jgi:type I restriction enzyme S subunit